MKTQAEIKQMSDEEILAMVKRVTEDKNTSMKKEQFCEVYGWDCSYGFLRTQLVERGWSQEWHKVDNTKQHPEIKRVQPQSGALEIEMKKIFGETSRVPYMVSKKVADEWRAFVKPFAMKSVLFDHALLSFMEAYNAGKIKFVLEKSQPVEEATVEEVIEEAVYNMQNAADIDIFEMLLEHPELAKLQ